MPLPEPLLGIGERIVEFFDGGGDPPFQLYVYDPTLSGRSAESLTNSGSGSERQTGQINVAAISLARIFWAALEDAGWMESLIEAEKEANGDASALAEVYESVGEILRDEPSLPDRVRSRGRELRRPDRCFPLPRRLAVPRLPDIEPARRPASRPPATRHPAVPRPSRRRVRAELHGSL